MAGMRQCPVCGKEIYDASRNDSKVTCGLKCRNAYYYRNKDKKFDRSIQMRLTVMKREYGVEFDKETIKRINADLKVGKCAICGRLREERERDFHIDHDHRTGKYRGILCSQCNHALGNIQDSPLHAIALCNYLIKTNARGIEWTGEFWGDWVATEAEKLIETCIGAE